MRITKEGFKAYEWDSTIREYVDKPIKHIFRELRDGCKIDPDVTLQDLILLVGQDKALSRLVGYYSWCDVSAFVTEVQKPCIKPCDIKYIELSRHITIQDAFRSLPVRLDSGINVSGIDASGKHWGISLTPINELAHCIVRLNPNTVIEDWRELSSAGGKLVVEARDHLSFLEVITEIFYEISFHGSPHEVAGVAADLNRMVEDIKSGKAKTVPFKDLDEDLDGKMIQ